jgi:hypothetical protein
VRPGASPPCAETRDNHQVVPADLVQVAGVARVGGASGSRAKFAGMLLRELEELEPFADPEVESEDDGGQVRFWVTTTRVDGDVRAHDAVSAAAGVAGVDLLRVVTTSTRE